MGSMATATAIIDNEQSVKTVASADAGCLEVYVSEGADPAADLAFEEALLDSCPPDTVRLSVYHWDKPVLVLGRGQSNFEVLGEVCDAEGIPVLRRRSGGTAVLHENTLNFALILPPEHPWASRIEGLYEQFVGVVGRALNKENIPVRPPLPGETVRGRRSTVCFENDAGETLLLHRKKVFGCAQRRRKRAVLVHGALLLKLDVSMHGRVFGVPQTHVSAVMTHLPACRPTDLTAAVVREAALALNCLPVWKEVKHDS